MDGAHNHAGLRRALGLAAAITLFTCASTARGGESEAQRADARVLFEQGVKQAAAGDSKAALASFRAAHEKSPNFRVLYNIGQLCARLGDTPCAVSAYERYLRESGNEIPSTRREAVEQELEALSRSLGSIRIRTSIKGAALFVDDVNIGKTPFTKPVTVSAGAHVIRLVAGDKVAEERVKVASGQSTSVTLEATRPAAAPPAPVPAEPPAAVEPPAPASAAPPATLEPAPVVASPAAPPDSRHVPVLPWVATGALAAATAVTGVLAAKSYASFQRTRDSYPVSSDELAAAQGSARDLFLVASGLGIATVVSAGLAIYFTVSSRPASTTGGVQGVRVAAGPRGVALEGLWP